MRLKDKIVIITGSAGGIGQASALAFAKEGAKLILVDINEKLLDEVNNAVHDRGGESISLKTDVSDSAQVQLMIDAAVQKWGRLDVLINNAGIESTKFVADFEEKIWDKIIDVNLKGAFLGSKYAFQQFIRQQSRGSIVNVSSILGLVSLPGCCAYSASKSGVIGLTRSLALDGGPYGIRVNCICPGFVLTGLTKPFLDSDNPEAHLQRIRKLTPISRIGTAEEIANAVIFLASDESSFVTGSILSVDGGMGAASPDIAVGFKQTEN